MKLLLLTLLLLAGCVRQPSAFDDYLSGIDKIETPITFYSTDYPGTTKYQKYRKDLFDKFSKSGSQELQGLVYNNENFVGLIFNMIGDINVPFLMTYDKKGYKIDSVNIFSKASETENGVGVSHATLYPDNKIEIASEIKTWDLNADNDVIAGTEKLVRDTIRLVIDNTGRIKQH